MKNRISKKLDIAKQMPALYHKLPDREFSVENSQVIKWAIEQPNILSYLWDRIKQSGYVNYDPKSGKWKGVNHDRVFYTDEDTDRYRSDAQGFGKKR